MLWLSRVQMESKLLRNGWTDESSPPVPLVPVNLLSSKPDSCRQRREGPSADGAAVSARTASVSTPTVARMKIGMPSWLSTWWNEFTSDKAIMVEVISRALFPLMFFIFNMVYWPWYLMWTAATVSYTDIILSGEATREGLGTIESSHVTGTIHRIRAIPWGHG